MDRPRYVYRARCVRVIDGDSFIAEIDGGFHCYHMESIRLRGVDTAEIRGEERPAGLTAKSFTEQWVMAAGKGEWPLVVETFKGAETFGRYVADALRAAGFDKGAVS